MRAITKIRPLSSNDYFVGLFACQPKLRLEPVILRRTDVVRSAKSSRRTFVIRASSFFIRQMILERDQSLGRLLGHLALAIEDEL